jgi:hypothetical protein
MPCEERCIVTTKQAAALVQINASIEHFQKGEYECAITLAAAAEGMLPPTEDPHLFTLLKDSPFFKPVDFNRYINWLKHPKGEDKTVLAEFEVTMVIVRAISKFIVINKTGSEEMKSFCRWAFARGHLPSPPSEENSN